MVDSRSNTPTAPTPSTVVDEEPSPGPSRIISRHLCHAQPQAQHPTSISVHLDRAPSQSRRRAPGCISTEHHLGPISAAFLWLSRGGQPSQPPRLQGGSALCRISIARGPYPERTCTGHLKAGSLCGHLGVRHLDCRGVWGCALCTCDCICINYRTRACTSVTRCRVTVH